MIEYLAIPARETSPTRLDAWVVQLAGDGGPAIITRESSSVAWLEVGPLRLKGYVIIENGYAAAINFELHALDPEPATRALEHAAEALGWELHQDDEDDEDDEADDD